MTIKPQARALLAVVALALAVLAATAGGAVAATRTTATPAAPATPATAALHGTRIALGATSGLYGNAFTEAPNGAVFFSRGSVVYVVEGNRAPVIALHAGGTVLALAANDSDLFAETGLRVTEYSRGSGSQVRHWTLTSLVASVTSAGLDVVGDTVWAWTDWATDGSGFEYAQIDRIHTSSSAVHVVDKDAFPGDMSADGAGLYFETVHGVTDDLGHANPTTTAVQYRQAPVDAPLALAGGRVDLLVFGSTAPTVNSYNANTLALLHRYRMLMVLWTVDTNDYLRPGVSTIVDRAVDGARPGAIILMHDAGGNRSETVAALPKIIAGLRKRGYSLVTVPQLVLDNPPPRDQDVAGLQGAGG